MRFIEYIATTLYIQYLTISKIISSIIKYNKLYCDLFN